MKVSGTELAALAGKAARGAGAPPAQAADFGRAALRHLAAGRDVAGLRDALASLPDGPILSVPLMLARALECAGSGRPPDPVRAQDWSDLATSYLEALPFLARATAAGQSILIEIDPKHPGATAPVARIDLPDDFASALQALAARTFVPETAASRLAGAGAGLTDND